MRKLVPATIVLLVALFSLAAVALAQDETPAVTVEDQAATGDEVVVSSVVYTGAGWIVIHTDENGQPGPVIGQTAVQAGENTDVVVALDETPEEGDMLWAMLHVDAGQEGTYEFPGADVPVTDENGDIVMQQFTVTGAAAAQATETVTATAEAAETATPAAAVTGTATPAAGAQATATPTTTAPGTLPTTGGTGGVSPLLSLGLLALGVLLILGVFAFRPGARES